MWIPHPNPRIRLSVRVRPSVTKRPHVMVLARVIVLAMLCHVGHTARAPQGCERRSRALDPCPRHNIDLLDVTLVWEDDSKV